MQFYFIIQCELFYWCFYVHLLLRTISLSVHTVNNAPLLNKVQITIILSITECLHMIGC